MILNPLSLKALVTSSDSQQTVTFSEYFALISGGHRQTSPTCLHCCGRVSDSPPNCVEM